MGQPIVLKKKGEPDMTVYGRSQAAVHVAEGWALEDDTIDLPTLTPEPVASDEKPKAAPKAKAKK